MSKATPLRYPNLRTIGARNVDGIGLPQIPEEAYQFMLHGRDNDMPPEVEAACGRAIAAAMAEHQRRRGAVIDYQE